MNRVKVIAFVEAAYRYICSQEMKVYRINGPGYSKHGGNVSYHVCSEDDMEEDMVELNCSQILEDRRAVMEVFKTVWEIFDQ
jgi:hypothetical protein